MNKQQKLKLCIYINLILMFCTIFSLFLFNNYQSNYFRFGWSDDFVFISFNIDTPIKYYVLCIFIILINISDVLMTEIADPILSFTTYNPYKQIIEDFTKYDLHMYSTIIFFIHTYTKKFFNVLITFSQIDVAFISIISSQVSGMIIINILLNEKKFQLPITNNQITYKSITENTPLYNKAILQKKNHDTIN